MVEMSCAFEQFEFDVSAQGREEMVRLLRHTCANRWWLLGVTLIEIARRLDHSSVETTMGYV